MFSLLFFFIASVKLPHTLRFLQKLLFLLKCLSSNAMKKSRVKMVEHKLEETFADGIRDVQQGRFILFRQNFSTTSQTYLALLH